MTEKTTKRKKTAKPRKLSVAWLRKNIEILKELGGALQALMGKKPLKTKVAIMANPENPLSMSILTRGQAKFAQLAEYMNSIPAWGDHWEGLKNYSDKMLAISPSVEGVGREQVIRLIGAMGESKLLERLGVTVKQSEKD